MGARRWKGGGGQPRMARQGSNGLRWRCCPVEGTKQQKHARVRAGPPRTGRWQLATDQLPAWRPDKGSSGQGGAEAPAGSSGPGVPLPSAWVTAAEASPNTLPDVTEAPRTGQAPSPPDPPEAPHQPTRSPTPGSSGQDLSSLSCFLPHGVMFCPWRVPAQMKRVSFILQILSQPRGQGAHPEGQPGSRNFLAGASVSFLREGHLLSLWSLSCPHVPQTRPLPDCASSRKPS